MHIQSANNHLVYNTLPHFCIWSCHIDPVAAAVYVEQEPLVQEPDEEIEVQPPQQEQAYPELQQEYYDTPEATGELTSDPSYQGRHPMHPNLCKWVLHKYECMH